MLSMDRPQAIERLPEAYAVALLLTDAGFDEPAVARVLHVEVEAVPPLLDLARAKLASLLDDGDDRAGHQRRGGC